MMVAQGEILDLEAQLAAVEAVETALSAFNQRSSSRKRSRGWWAENALLKLELHKWRPKAAAAKVAEERSKHKIFTLNGALKIAAASQKESSSRNGFLLEYEQKKEGKIYHSIYLHLLYS
nr:RB1-inducible coiled-coil protein 1-like isoform X1 [Ipomoea batatas]